MFAAISLLLILFCLAASEIKGPPKFEYYPLDIKVKELLKYPTPKSESSFVFPIDVTMSGVSKDKKWYRFKVSYDLVFFGKFEFEGWTQVDPFKPFNTGATPEVIELK